MVYYEDEFKKIPPQRPYCWSSKKYNTQQMIDCCKQCGFSNECERNKKRP